MSRNWCWPSYRKNEVTAVRRELHSLVLPLVLAVFGAATGCATTGGSFASGSGGTVNGDTFLDRGTGQTDNLATAKGLISSGQYSQAIPRLLKILDGEPGPGVAAEAHYHLGVAYEAIQSNSDAAEHYGKYLRLMPEGASAQASRDALQRLSGSGPVGGADEGAARIIALESSAAQAEMSLAEKLELADLYWKATRYDDAARIYSVLVAEQPGLMNDTAIRNRISVGADGKVTVLTPEEVSRQAYEAEPLVIHNTSSFRSGRQAGFTRSFQEVFYNVTGEALNRGTKALSNVQLDITIYGFGNRILETQAVSIGTLRPGARKPFSVRFSQFDDINNVDRYAVSGTYGE